MHILLLGASCALIATLGAPQVAPPVSPPSPSTFPMPPVNGEAPPGFFKIDGSKHPEQIPEHWIWRASFLKLATLKQAGQEGDLHPALRLSDVDAAALYKEAGQQPRRDSDCLQTVLTKREQLRAEQAAPEAVEKAVDDVTLDCRTKDLDAVDRVLDAMSSEGRDVLRAWVDAARRKMIAFVPTRDKNTFGLPR